MDRCAIACTPDVEVVEVAAASRSLLALSAIVVLQASMSTATVYRAANVFLWARGTVAIAFIKSVSLSPVRN